MAEPIVSAVAPAVEHREPEAIEFPGCRPVRIMRDEIADCEDRFEYWDADTEVAMVCEPVSYYHERPACQIGRPDSGGAWRADQGGGAHRPPGTQFPRRRQRAEHAEHLLSEERRRAERLAALLRRAGIDPERG